MDKASENKFKKLKTIYDKLRTIVESDKYGKEAHEELSSINPKFKFFLEASKRDLLSTDCAIVVAGEVSSGKTALINILLQTNTFESSLLPSTKVVTRIRNSEQRRVEVFSRNDEQKTEISIEQFKDFQHDKRNFKDVNCIDVYLPVPFLKENVILVDTPGLGDREEQNELLLKFLPNAVAFIFVVNPRNAGGVAADRIGRILDKVSAHAEWMPCFEGKDAIVLTNQWDSVENSLFLSTDKQRELQNTWDYVQTKLMEKFKNLPKENIFQISLLQVHEGKDTEYTRQYKKFKKLLHEIVNRNENKRFHSYLRFVKGFLDKANATNTIRLKQANSSEEELKIKVQNKEKQLSELKERTAKLRSEYEACRKKLVDDLWNKLKNYLASTRGKQKILNLVPEQVRTAAATDVPAIVSRNIERGATDWLNSPEIKEMINNDEKMLTGKLKEIVMQICEISEDLNCIELRYIINAVTPGFGFLSITALVFVVITFLTKIFAGKIIAALTFLGTFAQFIPGNWNQRVKWWLVDIMYFIERNILLFSNPFEKAVGEPFDKNIQNIFDEIIPKCTELLHSELHTLTTDCNEILTKKKLYMHLKECLDEIGNELNELDEM